ncbi:MAG: hypothetical protein M1816_006835 [Peltula sp. TS41687]|nr:MAG: hypothetical protein M1816_006835 [Peltula sp. TS41687]
MYNASVEHLEPQYDKAWKRFESSNMFEPSETEEDLYTAESGYRRELEKVPAEKTMDSGQQAPVSAQKSTYALQRLELTITYAAPQRQKMTIGEIRQQLMELNAAKQLVREFIRGTRQYRRAKEKVYRQKILFDLEKAMTVQGSSNANPPAKRSLKKQRQDNSGVGLRSAISAERPNGPENTAAYDGEVVMKRGVGRNVKPRQSSVASARPTDCPPSPSRVNGEKPRRSERLADPARRKACEIAAATPQAGKESVRQRPRRTAAQAPTLPNIGAQGRQSRPRVTKVVKRGGGNGGGRRNASEPKSASSSRRRQRLSDG